jgi:hypothetical protein
MILVLNHGELVEYGTHHELVALGGLYSQLHQAQMRIRSRSATEGGAAHEDQLIDSISQEVGDRLYSGGGGNGEATAPPSLEPPVPAPQTPAEPATPPAADQPPAPAQPPAQPVQPPSVPVGEPFELAASAGPPATSGGNGVASPNGANAAGNGHKQVVKKIQDGLQDEHPEVVCGYCQRTLLKGERAQPFIVPMDGRRRRSSRWDSMPEAGLDDMFSLRRGQGADLRREVVCEICWGMAEQDGWAPLHVIEHDR